MNQSKILILPGLTILTILILTIIITFFGGFYFLFSLNLQSKI